MGTISDEKLMNSIKSSLVNGKLPCAVAFKIADEFGVTPRYVKETADEIEVKISACQLGCFP